jgi:hypothetical protein
MNIPQLFPRLPSPGENVIGIDGSVEELEEISGHPLFIQSALDALRK